MTSEPETQLPPAAVMRNEFSVVRLSYARRGGSVSLVVTDTVRGNEIVLDSTELEALARAPHESFRRLLREIDEHDDPGTSQAPMSDNPPARDDDGHH